MDRRPSAKQEFDDQLLILLIKKKNLLPLDRYYRWFAWSIISIDSIGIDPLIHCRLCPAIVTAASEVYCPAVLTPTPQKVMSAPSDQLLNGRGPEKEHSIVLLHIKYTYKYICMSCMMSSNCSEHSALLYNILGFLYIIFSSLFFSVRFQQDTYRDFLLRNTEFVL